MSNKLDLKLAVLIDADNVPSAYLKEMLEEIAKYGTPTYKRIYGDWTSPYLTKWKSSLLMNAITPIQQYSYTQGKNSTDSAMIIDAMDILYTNKVDGFCIISSDSDFTRLALRLREAGMLVIGMGQKKTPAPFIAACNKFIYIEILQNSQSLNESELKDSGVEVNPIDKEFIRDVKEAVNDLAGEDGWTFLGDLGNFLIKNKPDFDPRNYGFRKLGMLIQHLNLFEIDERLSERGNDIKYVYVRLKSKDKNLKSKSIVKKKQS